MTAKSHLRMSLSPRPFRQRYGTRSGILAPGSTRSSSEAGSPTQPQRASCHASRLELAESPSAPLARSAEGEDEAADVWASLAEATGLSIADRIDQAALDEPQASWLRSLGAIESVLWASRMARSLLAGGGR